MVSQLFKRKIQSKKSFESQDVAEYCQVWCVEVMVDRKYILLIVAVLAVTVRYAGICWSGYAIGQIMPYRKGGNSGSHNPITYTG